jgi:putative IMPACT (imprinted ancient) family translation regulator
MPRARHQVSTRGSRLRGLSRAARSTTISGSADASPLGGTLLGAGGLVRAYGDAVRAGLEVTGALRRTLVREHLLDLDHADAGRIESELRSRGIAVLDTAYGAQATLRLGVPPDQEARLATVLAELTAGAAETTVAGERWVDSLDA